MHDEARVPERTWIAWWRTPSADGERIVRTITTRGLAVVSELVERGRKFTEYVRADLVPPTVQCACGDIYPTCSDAGRDIAAGKGCPNCQATGDGTFWSASWRPIATAPHRGRLLLRTESGETYVGEWVQDPFTGDEAFAVADLGEHGRAIVHPVLWMPLPPPTLWAPPPPSTEAKP